MLSTNGSDQMKCCQAQASASAEISFILNFTSLWAGVQAEWAGVHAVWAGVHAVWAGVQSVWAGVHPE